MAGSRTAAAGRLVRLAAVAAAMMGCYTLEPSMGVAPVPGAKIAVDLNDAGRVAMAGPLGPAVVQIEGRLTELDSAGFMLAVTALRMIGGGEQTWTGEPVRVRSEHVSRVYERKFSRGRTVAAGAIGGGVVVYLFARSILGSLTGDQGIPPSDTANSVRGRPRPVPVP